MPRRARGPTREEIAEMKNEKILKDIMMVLLNDCKVVRAIEKDE